MIVKLTGFNGELQNITLIEETPITMSDLVDRYNDSFFGEEGEKKEYEGHPEVLKRLNSIYYISDHNHR